MRVTVLLPALAAMAALAVPAQAGDTKAAQPPAPEEPVLQTAEPLPPVITGRTVRGRVVDAGLPGAAPGELEGLRVVSLREGAAEISLNGTLRKVKVGDPLGSGVVRAIGSDRIVLDRPFSVPGGTPGRATAIVTFDKGGEPRVRTIVEIGALPPPVPFEEPH